MQLSLKATVAVVRMAHNTPTLKRDACYMFQVLAVYHSCQQYSCDMLQTMTMKKIRQQLNAVFGVDLADRKDFLAAQVQSRSCSPFRYQAHLPPQDCNLFRC